MGFDLIYCTGQSIACADRFDLYLYYNIIDEIFASQDLYMHLDERLAGKPE